METAKTILKLARKLREEGQETMGRPNEARKYLGTDMLIDARLPPRYRSGAKLLSMGSYGIAVQSGVLLLFWIDEGEGFHSSTLMAGEAHLFQAGTPFAYIAPSGANVMMINSNPTDGRNVDIEPAPTLQMWLDDMEEDDMSLLDQPPRVSTTDMSAWKARNRPGDGQPPSPPETGDEGHSKPAEVVDLTRFRRNKGFSAYTTDEDDFPPAC